MRPQVWLILAMAISALAQQESQKKEASKQAPAKESAPAKAPAPLFGGQLGFRSSEKTKESATLGFNGVDPSGKVDQKMLATAATPDHLAQVRKLSDQRPSDAEVGEFVEEGGLKKK